MTKTVCDLCGSVDYLLFQFRPTPVTAMTEQYRLTDVKAFGFLEVEFCTNCIRKMLKPVGVEPKP